MAVATSTALLIAAGAAIAGAGATTVQAHQQGVAQKNATGRQLAAQNAAKQSALSQQIRAEQAQAAANRKTPDIASLLAFEQNTPPIGPSVDRSKLKLGKPSLLGDV